MHAERKGKSRSQGFAKGSCCAYSPPETEGRFNSWSGKRVRYSELNRVVPERIIICLIRSDEGGVKRFKFRRVNFRTFVFVAPLFSVLSVISDWRWNTRGPSGGELNFRGVPSSQSQTAVTSSACFTSDHVYRLRTSCHGHDRRSLKGLDRIAASFHIPGIKKFVELGYRVSKHRKFSRWPRRSGDMLSHL